MMDFVQLVKEMKPTLRDTSVHSYAVSLKSIAPPEATGGAGIGCCSIRWRVFFRLKIRVA